MELGSQVVVVSLELLNLSLRVIDIDEQSGVRLLSSEELLHHFLDVSHSSLSLDGLKGIVDLLGASHLLLHLLSQEHVPQLLNQQVLPHLELRRVLVLVGSCLCDLLVPPLSLDSLLDGGLLEGDASLELVDDLLSVPLLLFDVLHQVEEDGSALESLLLDLSLLLVLEL